ncbi:hypothetical protein Tco_0952501 [Tanacetum coccineum]|uniref:Uncharacterized protein n=1 Tax=Tanacetum coccineum TaxID=301880 RepID=A0ABQ5E013_9ASTR
MPLTNRASILNNPDPIISPAFIEANYEVLKSLLRERRRQRHNKDLRTELEYFTASSRVRRHKERVVEFEDAPNREGDQVERNTREEGRLGQKSIRQKQTIREGNISSLTP